MQGNLCVELGKDLLQTLRRGMFLVQADGAGRDVYQARGGGALIELDDTEAGELCAAVYSEYPHEVSLPQDQSWLLKGVCRGERF